MIQTIEVATTTQTFGTASTIVRIETIPDAGSRTEQSYYPKKTDDGYVEGGRIIVPTEAERQHLLRIGQLLLDLARQTA